MARVHGSAVGIHLEFLTGNCFRFVSVNQVILYFSKFSTLPRYSGVKPSAARRAHTGRTTGSGLEPRLIVKKR